MMIKGTAFVFLQVFVYIAILNLTLIAQSRKADRFGFTFENNSFTIRSTITEFNPTGPSRTVYLTEKYSTEQRRAKLTYHFKNSLESTKWFIHDYKTGASLLFNHGDGLCTKRTLNELYSSLMPRDSEILLPLMKSMDEEDASFSYLIGPVKLLQLIFAKVDSLRILNHADSKTPSLIRNHPVSEYILSLRSDSSPVMLRVFYDRTTFSLDKIQETVPLEIMILFSQTGHELVIDYYEHELIDSKSLKDDRPDEDSYAIIDEFTFPLSLECAKQLDGQQEKLDLFNVYDTGSLKFSFDAQSEWSEDNLPTEHFVAFDGIVQAMRIDDRKLTSPNKYSSTTSITDFRAGRIYNMMDGVDNCFAVQTFQAIVRGERLSFSKLILGTDEKLTYMGRAKVRGLSAQVFEVQTDRLPHWFSQPKPVKLPNGEFVGCYLNSCVESQPKAPELFRVLVYVDRKEDEVGFKLLLIEVYDHQELYRKPMFKTQFYDFQFNVKDAPNGDSAIELFSLKDRCNSGTKANRYAEVDLLLESESGADLESGWIQQWPSRDIALFSALRDTLSLPTSFVYGFESKLSVINSDRRMISATFRVAEHPLYFNVIYFIRHADFSGSKYGLISIGARSLVECFLKLDTVKPDSVEPIYVYYDNFARLCVFNKDLNSKNQTGLSLNLADLTYIFSSSKTTNGGIYKIQPMEDIGAGITTSWLKAERFETVENRVLFLQLTESINPVIPINSQVVKLRIRKAKLKSVGYMNRVGNEVEKAVKYPKLGLTSSERTKQFEWAMSIFECEAACLADLDCRTYSYCVRQGEVECLLSNMSISKNNSLLKAETDHKKRFRVKTDAGDELELLHDSRCELREKLYLDLFISAFPIIQPLQTQDVIPVNSREDCARICFALSLDALKTSVSMSPSKMHPDHLDAVQNHKQSDSKVSFCNSFKYLDAALSEKQKEIIEPLVTNKTYDSRFCILEKPSTGQTLQMSSFSEEENFKLNLFKFDFTHLYERKQGFILRKSSLRLEEQDALTAVSQNTNVEQRHYDILKRRLQTSDEPENFQLIFASSTSNCAEKCFMQSSNLWPSCGSFDHTSSFNDWAGFPAQSTCTLNTATLAGLNKTQQKELILEIPFKPGLRVYHYEPRFGLAGKKVENAYFFELQKRVGREGKSSKDLVSAKTGWIIIISFLAMVSGLVVGILVSGLNQTDFYLRLRSLLVRTG